MSRTLEKRGVPLIREKLENARQEIGDGSSMLADLDYLVAMVEKGRTLSELAMKSGDGMLMHKARQFMFHYFGEESTY